MPNPDFTAYVDLSIYDQEPQDIYENMILNMSLALPEWIPREGNTEVILLEAFSLAIANLMFAINRIPDSIMQVLLQMFDVYPDVGVQPTATLKFQAVDTQGYTVPAGTSSTLVIVDGIDPVVFTTDEELVIPAGETVGSTSATGDRYTEDANGTDTDTVLSLLDTLYWVDQVSLKSIDTPGRDEEDETAYLERGTERLSELSTALTLATQFASAALEDPDVQRAVAIDNYNPSSGHAPGTDGGYITVAVYGDGYFLPQDAKDELRTNLVDRAQANLMVNVIDAQIETLDVTCTVVAEINVDPRNGH